MTDSRPPVDRRSWLRRWAVQVAALILALPLTLIGTAGTARASTAPAYDSTWHQIGNVTFGGTTVDSTRFDVYNGTSSNPTENRSKSYVTVANGTLDLHTSGQMGSGLCWCRDRPTSLYGRWEIHEKVSAAAGHGEVTLLWPANNVWPSGGEIDISEINVPNRSVADSFVHYSATNQQLWGAVNGDFTQWHTFAVEWEPSDIKIWMDGKLYFATTNPVVVPHDPMYLALQTGPNEAAAPAVSDDLQVAWIKVFAP